MPKLSVRLSLILILAALPLARPAHARWATVEDSDMALDFENSEFQVKSDGTYTMTTETQIEILKESARTREATHRLSYNSRSSTLKVLEARTIDHGKSFPVDPKFIEDKPLASSHEGFDQFNQVMIAFPQLKVGSRLYVKYVMEVKEIPFEGVFTHSEIYGMGVDRKSDVKIHSEIPVFVETFDPEHVLKVTQEREKDGRFLTRVVQKKPMFKRAVDENDSYLNPRHYTWAGFSTTKDWAEIARKVLPRYEEILNAPLPESFAKIADKAAKKKDIVERLNFVLASIEDELHYLGDWRPVRGGHVPRPLETIAKSRFGDCKDLAASTAAILRKTGIDANVAFVKRDWRPFNSPVSLPLISAFNHAIVSAKVGDRVFWIDPTNKVAFAQGVMEDIIDRPSLVVDPKGPELRQIPAADPHDSMVVYHNEVDLAKPEALPVRGHMDFIGRMSIGFTGAELAKSKESLSFDLIGNVARINRLKGWSVDDYDLTSRIARDLSFSYQFEEDGPDLRTPIGNGFFLPSPPLAARFLPKLEDRVSDLAVWQPYTFRREYVLKNAQSPGSEALSCSIDSPWLTASRQVTQSKDSIMVTDETVLKKNLVTADELRSPEFSSLRQKIMHCFDRVALVYRTLDEISSGARKLSSEPKSQ